METLKARRRPSTNHQSPRRSATALACLRKGGCAAPYRSVAELLGRSRSRSTSGPGGSLCGKPAASRLEAAQRGHCSTTEYCVVAYSGSTVRLSIGWGGHGRWVLCGGPQAKVKFEGILEIIPGQVRCGGTHRVLT
jgi:hypothetical protein